MTIANEIAQENKVKTAREVAEGLVKALFENGSIRLPAAMRHLAVMTIGATLEEWRIKLVANTDAEIQKWKDIARDEKMAADELRLYIAQREREREVGG